jgi:hypothetical protein
MKNIFDIDFGDSVWIVHSGIYETSYGSVVLYPGIKHVKVVAIEKTYTSSSIFVNGFLGSSQYAAVKFTAFKEYDTDYCTEQYQYEDPSYDDVYVGDPEMYWISLWCFVSKKKAIKQYNVCNKYIEEEIKSRVKYLQNQVKSQKKARAAFIKNTQEILSNLKQRDEISIESDNKTI